eukprot:15455305-Alexandrium_andersonii.AAC.1
MRVSSARRGGLVWVSAASFATHAGRAKRPAWSPEMTSSPAAARGRRGARQVDEPRSRGSARA